MKKAVLGLKLNPWHDTGAAVIFEKDGHLQVFAISQERLDRVKNSRAFPRKAIDYCLDAAGLRLSEVEYVVSDYIWDPGVRDYPHGEESQQICKEHFFAQLDNLHIPYFFLEHHLCHAACAFYSSGFESATCLVVDGLGSRHQTQSIYDCSKEGIRKIAVSNEPGIGRLYTHVTREILSFGNLQEGKTMGLAAWGNHCDAAEVSTDFSAAYYDGINTPYTRFIQFLSDSPYDHYTHKNAIKPRSHAVAANTQPFVSYARDVQAELEKCVAHLANYAKEVLPNNKYLCYAGGIALNIPANRMLEDMALFDNIFIPPAPSDAGIPLGAALYGYYHYANGKIPYAMDNAFLARSYEDDAINQAALQWKGPVLENYELDDVAKLLNNNYILGWFQGASEYGPRALGARSILCNPCHPKMKDHLNCQVKHRESFRPFAPLVVFEEQAKFFDSALDSPYMLINMKVQPEWKDTIPAIVHVDGTARVQSVTRERQPQLYELLKTFEKYSGVPVLLNTSFNIAGEPIVETPRDAVKRFAESNLDALVLGKWLLFKHEATQYDHPNHLQTVKIATPADIFAVLKRLMNKKVVFFGTGSSAKRLSELLPVTVSYCVDNNSAKYTAHIEYTKILPPNFLLNEDKDELAIIIASQYHRQIANQLETMGFIENIHYWNGFDMLTAMNQK